ncbi:MAG: hypothetical protein CML24_00585 [Rhizobiales bacterium]|nr:hypothetical protein [Hyphomicrobiales bacterium]|tara:strand:+ start:632 stop:955 length:324 start_codon:yes stop_codon:yes gene_type:complete
MREELYTALEEMTEEEIRKIFSALELILSKERFKEIVPEFNSEEAKERETVLRNRVREISNMCTEPFDKFMKSYIRGDHLNLPVEKNEQVKLEITINSGQVKVIHSE